LFISLEVSQVGIALEKSSHQIDDDVLVDGTKMTRKFG
jgi:hypothetical protein